MQGVRSGGAGAILQLPLSTLRFACPIPAWEKKGKAAWGCLKSLSRA
jgi:hypothetical protein